VRVVLFDQDDFLGDITVQTLVPGVFGVGFDAPGDESESDQYYWWVAHHYII